MTKSKLKAILPLTSNQQSFLLHSLQHEETDSGIILVKVDLVGNLNIDLLKEAWAKTIHRHDALRTSIHWKKIEKPVQIIHEQAKTPLTFLDWSSDTEQGFEKKLEELKKENKTPFNLSKPPVSNIFLIKKSDSIHKMFWYCHHILLDGWSSAIIIKDLLAYYDSLHQGVKAQLDPIPSSKEYFNWLKNQPTESAKIFWKDYLKNLDTPTLFKSNSKTVQDVDFKDFNFHISEEHSKVLLSFSRKNRITVNTLLLGTWGLLLHTYFGRKNISFGTTVSGRTAPLDNLHLAAGLFMNVLPVALEVAPNTEISSWLKTIQANQSKTLEFEHNTLNQILTWIDAKSAALFDSLILFENFPWTDLKSGDLEAQNYRSGITTNHPLTLVVIPGSQYEFHFQYASNIIDEKTIVWFANHLEQIILKIISTPDIKINTLLNVIESTPIQGETKTDVNKDRFVENYIAPQNNTELQLTKMWETLLGFSPIGATDNFFEIGGKSLHAVRLLGQIEQTMGHNLPPITLIQNPTIRELSALISGDKSIPDWSYLVPIRTAGTKPPLFCLHAGGGHTFFYNAIANYLDSEQPVYSVQPFLSNVKNKLHGSMEDMATDYLKDIRAAQPEGPYIFLVYCFSIALGIEMLRQLEKIGITNASLINIDTPLPNNISGAPPPQMTRLKNYWKTEGSKKILSLVKRKIYLFPRRIDNFYTKKIKPYFENEQEKALRTMVSNLQKIHVNYHWKKEWQPIKSKVTYIQSTESVEARGVKEVKRFNDFFTNKIEVITVAGKHRTLFEQPEIKNLSEAIQISLDNGK